MKETHSYRNLPEDELFQRSRMSFGDHLLELRSAIIKSIYGLAIGFVVALFFSGRAIEYIATPLVIALKASGYELELYASSPPEAFTAWVRVALYLGILISSPWVFYQMWGFIAAGLYPHERRFVNLFAPFSAILFILGGVFFIMIVAPISFNFFIVFGSKMQTPTFGNNPLYRVLLKSMGPAVEVTHPPVFSDHTESSIPPEGLKPLGKEDSRSAPEEKIVRKPLVRPLFTLQKYISFVTWLSLTFGLAFQMPLVVLALGRLRLVSMHTFTSMRRYVIFVILIVSAMITPPDVLSQIALSIPMYGLYELGILLLKAWPTRA